MIGDDNKKGQASTEYLIILAVVVIIALIVVAILGGFPAIGRGTSAQVSAAYWTSAVPVGITSYELTDTATSSSIILLNNGRSRVNVSSIQFDGVVDDIADLILTPGGDGAVALTSFTCTAGDTYDVALTINYSNMETGQSGLLFTGDVNLVGDCLDV